MQKVIIINLNGNAYQLDEDAYAALRIYLDNAEAQLAFNPDKTEIVADLEQAIAEKCMRFLAPHKTVAPRSIQKAKPDRPRRRSASTMTSGASVCTQCVAPLTVSWRTFGNSARMAGRSSSVMYGESDPATQSTGPG